MAIRLVVEFIDLQVSVQSQEVSLSVETSDSSAPSLSTLTTNLDLLVRNQVIAPIRGDLINFVDLSASTTFVNLDAQIFIDSDTKNLYFYAGHPNAEIITMSELASFVIAKPFEDAFSMLEDISSINTSLGKNESISLVEDARRGFSTIKTDSFALSEASSLSLENLKTDAISISESSVFNLNKNPSDGLSISETSFRNLNLSKSDTANILETHAVSYTTPKSDGLTVSESAALAQSLAKTDSLAVSETSLKLISPNKSDLLSIAENLSRVVSYSRTFSDTVSLDDRASVEDPLQTDVTVNKDNVAFMTEEHLFSLSRPLSDNFSILESLAKLQNKNITETVTFTDSESFSTSLGKTESMTLSDADAKSLGLGKSDSFSMTESSVRLANLGKSDSVSMSEEHLFTLGISKSDTVSLSEVDVISLSKQVEADSFSVTESISILLTVGGSSVLNTSAFNTNALN